MLLGKQKYVLYELKKVVNEGLDGLEIVKIDWAKPFIKDIYKAQNCEEGDEPIIAELWQGAQHLCLRDYRSKYDTMELLKGATCSAASWNVKFDLSPGNQLLPGDY